MIYIKKNNATIQVCGVQVFALLSRAAHHQSAAERLCALQHHMVHEVHCDYTRQILWKLAKPLVGREPRAKRGA